MKSKYVILTIQTAGPKTRPQFVFQFGNNFKPDLQDIPCKSLIILLDKEKFDLSKSLKSYIKFNRITHPKVHKWIIENNLNKATNRNPIKLIFSFSYLNGNHMFKFYPNQANIL